MVFSSKKDWWLGGIIWIAMIPFFYIIIQSIFIEFSMILTIISLVFILFVGDMWFNTKYVIARRILEVRSGFLKKKKVFIDEIHTIRFTKNPIAAPALSLDRIEINYNQYDTIIISPRNSKRFIHEIIKINPKIKVNKTDTQVN
ncbi:PH domain-containing protein [Oceanobacillus locisalsi]|uniref:PH domain-containing protein n=1 Tax=Oceanobacillus locisalsi TaxID=546107 RepID=A0ABW3NNU4_9BACI